MNVTSNFTLVLGGAASGKSDFAEALTLQSAKAPVYLATAQAFDDEMRRKIDDHIARRGDVWSTVETSLNAAQALSELTARQICLFDCVTMWLNNQMMANSDISAARVSLLKAIDSCAADIVVVSNEVGHGIVPENALARQFREMQGRLNVALAEQAGTVVQVTAGLPLVLKGSLT